MIIPVPGIFVTRQSSEVVQDGERSGSAAAAAAGEEDVDVCV